MSVYVPTSYLKPFDIHK